MRQQIVGVVVDRGGPFQAVDQDFHEQALFADADCATVTGSDETLLAIRKRLPPRVRFLGYGHRVSFGYITGDALARFELKQTVERAANDVVREQESRGGG